MFFRGWGPRGQTKAHDRKPSLLRVDERLKTRLSELAGLVLAGQKDYLTNLLSFEPTVINTLVGIRTSKSQEIFYLITNTEEQDIGI